MGSQNPPDGGLHHLHPAFGHLADNAREASASTIVDVEDGGNLFRPGPRPPGLLDWCPPVGLALLVAFEPMDEALGRENPTDECAEGADELLGESCSAQPFFGGQWQSLTPCATLGDTEFQVDHLYQ